MVDEPITQRITASLRRQIEDGTLGPGALLPSETELAQAHGVSRQTARTAMQALEREGLVVLRPRRGRIVRSTQRLRWRLSEFERPDHTVLTTSDAWETDIESQGHDPATDPQRPEHALTFERISPPPPAVAQRLKIDLRTGVCVVRRHVRYIDGRPAIISDDFFDQEIVRGTELDIPEDTTRENILAEAGYEQVYDVDEIITRMPTPEEIERLGIAPGTPVAEHIRTGYTSADRAVRVMISIIPGDTLILQYTVPT